MHVPDCVNTASTKVYTATTQSALLNAADS